MPDLRFPSDSSEGQILGLTTMKKLGAQGQKANANFATKHPEREIYTFENA